MGTFAQRLDAKAPLQEWYQRYFDAGIVYHSLHPAAQHHKDRTQPARGYCGCNGRAPASRGWPAARLSWLSPASDARRAGRNRRVGLLMRQGGGFIVVDVDVKKGREGEATLARVLDGRELPATYEVRTPSGGRHLYFRIAEEADVLRRRSGIGDHSLGAGLDLPLQVAAPPTEDYAVSRWAEIAAMPGWLIEALAAIDAEPQARLLADDADGEEPPSWAARDREDKGDILDCLYSLSAESYEQWIAVGMQLKGGGAPFEVWDRWSSRRAGAAEYDEDVCREKWESFGEPARTGIGALIRLAERSGFDREGAAEDRFLRGGSPHIEDAELARGPGQELALVPVPAMTALAPADAERLERPASAAEAEVAAATAAREEWEHRDRARKREIAARFKALQLSPETRIEQARTGWSNGCGIEGVLDWYHVKYEAERHDWVLEVDDGEGGIVELHFGDSFNSAATVGRVLLNDLRTRLRVKAAEWPKVAEQLARLAGERKSETTRKEEEVLDYLKAWASCQQCLGGGVRGPADFDAVPPPWRKEVARHIWGVYGGDVVLHLSAMTNHFQHAPERVPQRTLRQALTSAGWQNTKVAPSMHALPSPVSVFRAPAAFELPAEFASHLDDAALLWRDEDGGVRAAPS